MAGSDRAPDGALAGVSMSGDATVWQRRVVIVGILVGWLVFFVNDARGQEIPVMYFCLAAEPGSGVVKTVGECVALHGADAHVAGHTSYSSAKDAGEAAMDALMAGLNCVESLQEDVQDSTGTSEGQTVRRFRSTRRGYTNPNCVSGSTSGNIYVWEYYVLEDISDICEPSGTAAGQAVYPLSSGVPECMNVGHSAVGCSVVPVSVGPVEVRCVGDRCRVRLEYTGQGCDVGEVDYVEDVANQNVTCIVMSGQTHCWHKDDPECQYVNGEKWCMGDVEVQPIMTYGGQLLSLDPGILVDSEDDPVTPDSEIDVDSGGSSQTVNHYDSSSVVNNTVTGAVGGNPNQAGGVPGEMPLGGSGDGDGDGDGDGEEGSVSGGVSCSDPPECDGDPIGCAILAQQYRQRCNIGDDAYSDEAFYGALSDITGDEDFDLLYDSEGSIGDLSEALDDTGWLSGGRACPADVTLNFGMEIGNVEVPLSMLCPLLEITGMLILFMAGFRSLIIVGGAI